MPPAQYLPNPKAFYEYMLVYIQSAYLLDKAFIYMFFKFDQISKIVIIHGVLI